MSEPETVIILAYPGMTLLDAIGPLEVLANSEHFEVHFAAHQPSVINDHGNLTLTKILSLEEVKQADILLVPGGPGDRAVMANADVLAWIQRMDQQTRLTTSVCTGSLILAAAGLLHGRKACSHWAYLQELESLGARSTRRRFIQDGKYLTASGVSAGIDMALHLVKRRVSAYHAFELRFGIEYFPGRHYLISSYTLPMALLKRLATQVHAYLNPAREHFLGTKDAMK